MRVARATLHWPAAIIALAALLATAGCRLLPREEVEDLPALVAPPEEELVTHILSTGSVSEELQRAARVGSGKEQALYFTTSGRIRQVMTNYGDRVKKGQPLITLETGDLDFYLKRAKLELEQEELRYRRQYGDGSEAARALRLAELDLDRAELDLAQAEDRLQAEGKTCPAQQRKSLERDVERMKLALTRCRINYEKLAENSKGSSLDQRIAELDVERARVEYERLLRQTENSILRAPFAGKVTSLSATRGRQADPYAPLAVISDMKGLEMVAEVSSDDVYLLRSGMRVRIQMREGTPRLGKITIIEPPDQGVSGNNKRWVVHMQLDDSRFPFKFDDYYSVAFILRSADRTLLAPNDALREDVNGKKYLRVIDGKLRRDVYIKTGIKGDTHTQILEGAEPGMVVIGR